MNENNEYVEVNVTSNTLKWYKDKGYDIPVTEVQLYAYNKNGKKIKNGKDYRVTKGTKILVKLDDLPPSSNKKITLTCEYCGKEFTTTFGAYKKKKKGKRCNECAKKRTKGDGTHGYWVKKLITDNPNACCDISGETDKRFLVLHHLDSRSNGGKNVEENYVILSSNYHTAFHRYMGGTNIPCTKKDYIKFKEEELSNIMSQSDVLAEDWIITK